MRACRAITSTSAKINFIDTEQATSCRRRPKFCRNGLLSYRDGRFFQPRVRTASLLSAFAKMRRRARVLDLGCGTARSRAALAVREDPTVTDLRYSSSALDLFRRSIERNRLENVAALHGDLRRMRTLPPHGSMDYVICIAYFGRNTGATAPSAEKRTARQDICCTVEEVAVARPVPAHRRQGGLCVPSRTAVGKLLEALSASIVPKRLRFVRRTRSPFRAPCSSACTRAAARESPQRRAAAAGRERGISKIYGQNRQFRTENLSAAMHFISDDPGGFPPCLLYLVATP